MCCWRRRDQTGVWSRWCFTPVKALNHTLLPSVFIVYSGGATYMCVKNTLSVLTITHRWWSEHSVALLRVCKAQNDLLLLMGVCQENMSKRQKQERIVCIKKAYLLKTLFSLLQFFQTLLILIIGCIKSAVFVFWFCSIIAAALHTHNLHGFSFDSFCFIFCFE